VSERGRVLLFDRDRHALVAATELLEQAGFEIVISGRQHGRLEYIDQVRPDLVLLGVVLARAAEDEVLRACAAGRVLVPVLIVSAREPAILEGLVRDSGAAGYVFKPLLRDDLVARVRECVALRRRLQLSSAR
jgi:DNA-binding response OmpR family regulator